MDKYVFINLSLIPQKLNTILGKQATSLIPFAVIIHLVMSIWVLSNRELFTTDLISSTEDFILIGEANLRERVRSPVTFPLYLLLLFILAVRILAFLYFQFSHFCKFCHNFLFGDNSSTERLRRAIFDKTLDANLELSLAITAQTEETRRRFLIESALAPPLSPPSPIVIEERDNRHLSVPSHLNRSLFNNSLRPSSSDNKELKYQISPATKISYNRAIQRNLIKGLDNYNILKNPKYQELFGVTWKFSMNHGRVRSISKMGVNGNDDNDGDLDRLDILSRAQSPSRDNYLLDRSDSSYNVTRSIALALDVRNENEWLENSLIERDSNEALLSSSSSINDSLSQDSLELSSNQKNVSFQVDGSNSILEDITNITVNEKVLSATDIIIGNDNNEERNSRSYFVPGSCKVDDLFDELAMLEDEFEEETLTKKNLKTNEIVEIVSIIDVKSESNIAKPSLNSESSVTNKYKSKLSKPFLGTDGSSIVLEEFKDGSGIILDEVANKNIPSTKVTLKEIEVTAKDVPTELEIPLKIFKLK